MKASNYSNRSQLEVSCCPLRAGCPLALLCGSQLPDGRYLMPAVTDEQVGELVWTDLNMRRRLLVVRQGLLVSTTYANEDIEIPNALFSVGMVGGIPDIFMPYVASDFYYFSALVPSRICSFDGDMAREQIERMPATVSHAISSSISLNHGTSLYAQSLTSAHQSARNRTASAIMRLFRALSRNDGFDGTVAVTHETIAFLARVQRATASKELQALAQEGLIELKYKAVRPLPGFWDTFGSMIEASLPFYETPTFPID